MERPISLDEINSIHKDPLRNAVAEAKTSLRWHERFALWMTERVGSIGFFGIIFCWTILWVIWNMIAPTPLRFDPYPSFVIWLFISNMIQILLLPLILVGQNLQAKNFEVDAEADYDLNRLTNHQIETILRHLEYQNEMIEELYEKVR